MMLHKFIMAIVIISLLGAAGIIGISKYLANPHRHEPLIFAEKDMLQELWNSYKINYIEPGTNRTLDKQQANISTSEGQSYAMMRAVWMDDQKTFDDSFQWAKDNLQRDDYLFSWKFGQLPDGKYGIQDTIGGQNTASDGDSDIALSLLMAYSRWKQDKYLYDAIPIISSIWEKEVVEINGKPVLVANYLERNNDVSVIINPSYFAPYAYKIFAQLDKDHDWTALADNSYEILRQAATSPLNTNISAGLPPDWVAIDRSTGNMSAVASPDLTTKFSFDAIRTPWRLALDYKWYKDERSKNLLAGYSKLAKEWQSTGHIAAIYKHDGTREVNYETPATYGATLGYFDVIEPKLAEKIYRSKLSTVYDPDEQRPKKQLSYYDDNWSWFGMALYLDQLPNLTRSEQRNSL